MKEDIQNSLVFSLSKVSQKNEQSEIENNSYNTYVNFLFLFLLILYILITEMSKENNYFYIKFISNTAQILIYF